MSGGISDVSSRPREGLKGIWNVPEAASPIESGEGALPHFKRRKFTLICFLDLVSYWIYLKNFQLHSGDIGDHNI